MSAIFTDRRALMSRAPAMSTVVTSYREVPLIAPSLFVRLHSTLVLCLVITCAIGILAGCRRAASPTATLVHEAPGHWQKLTPMPAARSEVVAVALDGRVYVIGGLASGGRVSSQVEAYNPDSDAWDTKASLPVPLHHTSAAVVGGRLYVIGGFTSGFRPVGSVYEYDPTANTWREREPMPTARGALAAVALEGKIYAIGGVKGFGQRNVGALEVYDPSSDSWESRSPMRVPRDHLAAGVVGEKIYAIGGRLQHSFGSNLNVNEEYAPVSDTWTTRAPLPTTREWGSGGCTRWPRLRLRWRGAQRYLRHCRGIRPGHQLVGRGSSNAHSAAWPRGRCPPGHHLRHRWWPIAWLYRR